MREIARDRRWRPWFRGGSISAREFGIGKPDPRIFHEACRRLGCGPREVLHVGDDLALDALGARSAGLHTSWLRARTGRAGDARRVPGAWPTVACLADAWALTGWAAAGRSERTPVCKAGAARCGCVSANFITSKRTCGRSASVGGVPRPMTPLPCSVQVPRRRLMISGSLSKRT